MTSIVCPNASIVALALGVLLPNAKEKPAFINAAEDTCKSSSPSLSRSKLNSSINKRVVIKYGALSSASCLKASYVLGLRDHLISFSMRNFGVLAKRFSIATRLSFKCGISLISSTSYFLPVAYK